jgi:hypothetical protein
MPACDQLQTFAAVVRHHAPLRRVKPTAGWPRFVEANDLPARAFRPTVTSICDMTTKFEVLGRHGVDISQRRPQDLLPLLVVAVTHYQTVARLVDLVSELLDVGGNFSEQRGREHLPGTVANDLIEQRPTDTGNAS